MNPKTEFEAEAIDRVNSPLIGSFIFSWMLIHWRVIVGISFGPPDPNQNRIDFIASQLFSRSGWPWFVDMILFPLCAAVFYVAIHVLTRHLFYYVERHFREKRKRRDLEDKIEHGEYQQWHDSLRDLVASANLHFKQLKNTLTAAENTLSSTDPKIRNLSQIKEIEAQIKTSIAVVDKWREGKASKVGMGGDIEDLAQTFEGFKRRLKTK